MADDTSPDKDRLTLRGAVKDLGWFAWLFTIGVGAPSVLALAQAVVVDYRLIDALQWIPDGFNTIMAVLSGLVDPWFDPLLAWLNDRFGWRLTLHDHWRPLFALMMIFVMALVRTSWRDGLRRRATLIGVVTAPLMLLASLGVGLIPLDGVNAQVWWARAVTQGAIAGVTLGVGTFAFALAGAAVKFADGREYAARENILTGLLAGGGTGGVGCAVAAGLSFVPGVGPAAGAATLAGVIVVFAALALNVGLSAAERNVTRLGLTMLGGFVAAGLIAGADAAVKALGWG